MNRSLFVLALSLLLLNINQLSAKETYHIPRIANAPLINGELGAGEWDLATQVQLGFETHPGDSVPAKVKTTAYMMEDGENLYFAFQAFDPNPEQIRAFVRDRDGIFQDDFVGVILDTFNDERRGFEFFVNPMGSQGDLTRDDILNNEDSSWNTIWDSAGQVNEQGYWVEMSIPFRSLRFPSGLAKQQWGIEFLRIYPRDSRAILSDSKSDREISCSLCQANKVSGMPELQSMNASLDIIPTLTYTNNETRDVQPLSDWDSDSSTDFGADVRWSMTEDWVLNGTLNPDFSQVEADAGQLDINTTFSLFFPEARPFFLDGADYFKTHNRLVHTRNIADPDYGLKVTGKSNGYSLGVIVADDDNTSFLIPSSLGSYVETLEDNPSNILVARGQSDIGKKDSIGFLVTDRSATDYKNTLFSLDGKHYFTDKDILSYQVMHSTTDNPESIRYTGEDDITTPEDERDELLPAEQSDEAIYLNYSHNEDNYSLRASYNDYGKYFRADMGFIGQVDYKKLILGGDYTWYGEEDSKWTSWGFFGDWDRTEDQSGKMLETERELHMNVRGPLQFNTNFGLVDRERFFDDQYFDESQFMMWFQVKPTFNFTFGNFMMFGDQIDFTHSQLGEISLFEPYIEWQASQNLSIKLNYSDQTLDVDGGELFNASVVDLRMAYQFSNRSRLSLTIQSFDINRNEGLYAVNQDLDPDNNVLDKSKQVGNQLIYSYKINPQSLFYLGYSDNALEDDNVQSLRAFDKTIFAKISYLWQH